MWDLPVIGRVAPVRAVALALGAVAVFLLVAGLAVAYEAHGPIVVRSVDDLEAYPGHGTRSSPYVISGYEIAATQSHGIDIADVTAHVVLRDLRIANGGSRYDGIVLTNVRNVTVEDTFLEGNRNGVAIAKSSAVVVERTNINSTSVGVVLDATKGVSLRDNVFPQNERGIHLSASTNNTFLRNRLTLASGQYGFYFADNASVANVIGTTNLVNEAPMQWYVDVHDIRVDAPRVDVRGITNVAQMLVYRSSDVRVEDALLTNGTAHGLFVWQSEEVVVTGSNASVNVADGVRVLESRRVRFLDGDASVNGGDGVRVEKNPLGGTTSANQVGRVVAVGNKGAAVSFLGSHAASAFDVVARGNGVGILATGVLRGLDLTDNEVSGSKGIGLNVTLSDRNVSVTGNVVAGNGGDGIRISQTGGGVNVRNNDVTANKGRGISLERITGPATVAENRVSWNLKPGLSVFRTFNSTFEDNVLERNPRDVVLSNATKNRFVGNAIVKAENETGFWFEDVFSYDNPIAPDTTVNGVPVQWRVGLKGTEKQPVVLADVVVDVPNMTNVAQIGFHNSSWIRLERPLAANGAGVGIMLHQSHDVRVLDAVVRDNLGSGILVRSTSGVHEARAAANVVERANVTGNGAGPNDAGVKVQGTAATANVLRDSVVADNRRAGVRLEQAGARNVVYANDVRGNSHVGIALDRATLATIQRNVVGNHSRGVEIGGSVSNLLQGNEIAIGPGAYGLYFRDEASYSNDVLANTTVNGVGVQWFTFVDGREGAPVVLRPDPVELRGITNVAQVLVFKSSWIRLEGVVAANASERGVLIVKSSAVEIANATARDSPVGIELSATLGSRILDAVVAGDAVGIRLNASSGNTVARAVAWGTKVPVRLVASEDNRVWGTNATDAGAPILDDATFKPGTPNVAENLLVDAGPDREADPGEDVTFTGVVVASPFRNEPVVLQSWDFGDGETIELRGGDASQPVHAFAGSGRHVVRLTVATPTASYVDEAVVTVRPPPPGGPRVEVLCDPAKREGRVGEPLTFACLATLVEGAPGPFDVAVKEKAVEVANVTVDLVEDAPTRFTFTYTANATGDHLLRVSTSTVVHAVVSEAEAPEDGRFLPASTFGAVAALGVAALRRARALRP